MKTCKDCRYHVKHDEVIGFCHLIPPTPISETTATFPPVKSAETWCGQLERKGWFK